MDGDGFGIYGNGRPRATRKGVRRAAAPRQRDDDEEMMDGEEVRGPRGVGGGIGIGNGVGLAGIGYQNQIVDHENAMDSTSSNGSNGSYPELPESSFRGQDWQYVQRRTAQEIIPGLYLGPYASATTTKRDDMLDKGITHVICIRQIGERRYVRANHEGTFKYKLIEMGDSPNELLIPRIKECNAFIDECLSQGGKVLIHGNAGLSRSPTFAIAYIMWRYGVPVKKAQVFVQQKRFCINPSDYFLAQLYEFEPIAQAMHSTPLPLPDDFEDGQGPGALKRGREDDDESPKTLKPNPNGEDAVSGDQAQGRDNDIEMD